MKSAYELAMERLKAAEPDTAPLSAEQKERLAELDARYKAKIAEREIFLQKAYHEALERGEAEEVVKIRQQMTNEKARLENEREAEKERVRRGR
ncbi:MAG TPA: hypothetical protein VK163_13090 [Opitutaceae bacterium]|nr:hypothetical protein [Opitutaceae bacterium]